MKVLLKCNKITKKQRQGLTDLQQVLKKDDLVLYANNRKAFGKHCICYIMPLLNNDHDLLFQVEAVDVDNNILYLENIKEVSISYSMF